jgi:intracellular septation protein A
LLTDVDRGIYGVFFTAFFLGTVVVSELILVPAQVVAVGLPRNERLGVTKRSLTLGLIPGLAGILAALAAAAWTRDLTSAAVITALTLTTGLTIVVSPLQDHVRQLLHIADRSWRAVAVSSVQLISVASSIGILLALDVERAWIPFGSLAAANVVSLTTGLVLARGHQEHESKLLTFRGLVESGKWLVIRAATPATLAFVAANILTQLAGPIAYGYAEAARQVAQPITVLSVGLMAVLGPRAVRAGSETNAVAGAHNRRTFIGLMLLASTAYVALAGFDWFLNPMALLVPAAYAIGGLVIATIIANVLAAVFLIFGRELLGAGQARSLAVISLVASPALPLAALTAGSIEAFARPLGYIIEGSIRVVGGRWWLHRHYRTDVPPPGPVTVADSPERRRSKAT